MSNRYKGGALATLLLMGTLATPALAQEQDGAWDVEVVHTADVTGLVHGGTARAGRFLNNLEIAVDGDLARAIGWRDARLHVSVLANGGGEPNAVAGTLQGVDNIEVDRQAVRLFEFWVEQTFADGGASLLAGLYDVNSEFYATEASGLLIAPPFGIGSELASTGPNGPSIFPSTSLAARLRVGDPAGLYGQAAVVNANASTLGDPHGVDTDLRDGVLLIGEGGWTGPARIALGAWGYSRKKDDIRELDTLGDPASSEAYGAYVLGEMELHGGDAGPRTRAFFRAGVSDGDTTAFKGGWQGGVLVEHLFASRPDSAFSAGLHQGLLSAKARANLRAAGTAPAHEEEGLELTYSDAIGRLTIQPDLQVIRHPGGDSDAETVVVAALRLTVPLN